ncbi:MAG TPA: TetR/AcrR family transcriptional regulator [Burkholderiales bacterium]|jgi:AcrR family transcriptional regulator
MRRALTAKEKIDRTAYALFTRHGIRAVGVDTIVARSGVGKMTLYRHYPSKDALALAFLDRRLVEFSRGWQSSVEARGLPPREALLAVFDVLEEWYHSPGYTGCPVVKAVLESRSGDPVHAGALRYFSSVRGFLRKLAAQAGVRDPDALAAQWHLLIWGSIIGARAQDRDAARRAKQLAAAILTRQARPARRRHRSPR